MLMFKKILIYIIIERMNNIKLLYRILRTATNKIYYTLYYNKSKLKIHIIKGFIKYTMMNNISQTLTLMIVDNYFLK